MIHINLLHSFLIAPILLLLVNYPQFNADWVRIALIVAAFGVVFHHGMKWLVHAHWVHAFHVVVVSLVLLTIAWQGKNVTPGVRSVVTMLALGAIVYHMWRAYGKFYKDMV